MAQRTKRTPVYKFVDSQQGWCDVTGRVPYHLPAPSYSCFSYNIWFQGWNQTNDSSYRQQLWLPRQRALLDQAKAADADFLCFQEVTNPSSNGRQSFLELLLNEDWIQRDYYVSDVTGQSTFQTWYGVVIASRVPIRHFTVLQLPSRMGRYAVIGHVHTPNGTEEIAVGTAHLESPCGSQDDATRVQQLQLALEYLKDVDTAMFMGDFNITNEQDMVRVWDAAGFNDSSGGETSWFGWDWRPDRIIARTSDYAAVGKAQVGGASPSGVVVTGQDGDVATPSDHFSLTLRFNRKPGAPVHQVMPAEQLQQDLENDLERISSNHSDESQFWAVEQTQLAVAADSELIYRGCNNVTDAVAQLNHSGSTQRECYVYSDFKRKWYKLWRGRGGWSLQCTQEAVVVDPELILPYSEFVQEAIDMLNRGECEWPHDTCYVYSDYKKAWYKLWSTPMCRADRTKASCSTM